VKRPNAGLLGSTLVTLLLSIVTLYNGMDGVFDSYHRWIIGGGGVVIALDGLMELWLQSRDKAKQTDQNKG